MANQLYFLALGDPSFGLTAAVFLLEAYERNLREENYLSEEKLGSETFSKVVLSEYVKLCLIKGHITKESLPHPLEKWSLENFDKFPALRIEAIKIAFNRCCNETEKKEAATSTSPQPYTTRTFAKPHPIAPIILQAPHTPDVSRAPIETRYTAAREDTKSAFQEALMAHLARKKTP